MRTTSLPLNHTVHSCHWAVMLVVYGFGEVEEQHSILPEMLEKPGITIKRVASGIPKIKPKQSVLTSSQKIHRQVQRYSQQPMGAKKQGVVPRREEEAADVEVEVEVASGVLLGVSLEKS